MRTDDAWPRVLVAEMETRYNDNVIVRTWRKLGCGRVGKGSRMTPTCLIGATVLVVPFSKVRKT